MSGRRRLGAARAAEVRDTLEARFAAHPERHPRIAWSEVAERLGNGVKLWSLSEMERTGGEPDVVAWETSDEVVVVDCAAETPAGRRNVCYDRPAQESRKDGLARANMVDMAAAMGVEVLGEEEYRRLQSVGRFDSKTSSWLRTPADVRDQGGAIFGHLRFGRVFVCPNGAQSFYGSRGFRSLLRI